MIRNHPEGSLLVKRCGKPVSGWARQDSCPSYFLCFGQVTFIAKQSVSKPAVQ